MALILQQGPASRRFDGSSIQRATGQSGEIIEQVMAHMLEREILFEDSGVVGLGPVGERVFGARNYMALMSEFDTPPLFQLICGTQGLGLVHRLPFTAF